MFTAHHLFVDGSSTGYGLGDESGRRGFGGRLATHFDKHNERQRNLPPALNPDPKLVFTHLTAQVERRPRDIAHDLGHTVARAHRLFVHERTRQVGIFVIGGLVEGYATGQSDDRFLESWGEDVRSLLALCGELQVKAVIAAPPHVDKVPLFRGRIGEPNYALRDKAADLTRSVAADAGVEYVAFEGLLGPDVSPDPYLAPDRRHPNARGHELMYRHLLSTVEQHVLGDGVSG